MKSMENTIINKYITIDGKKKDKLHRYQEYIKASQKLRQEINLEEDPIVMLDKALLCISLLTHDSVFYIQNRNKLIDYICRQDN